jgi:hypothetical protein
MIGKQDIKQYVDYTYNSGITTYDQGNTIRVTNGSAGYYADFTISDTGNMVVQGERYGEVHDEVYQPTQEMLEQALHDCLGL